MQLYNSKEYAVARLAGTVIRTIKGIAVRFKMMVDDGVLVSELISGDEKIIPYKELDIDPVPLGYCNFGTRAVYISRTPKRTDWRQGLRVENMRTVPDFIPDIDGESPPEVKPPGDTSLGKTIQNIYPSLQDCVKAIMNGKIKSIAFDRNFSLDSTFTIHHKGIYRIGEINPNNPKRIELDPEYWWCKEAFEESVA